MNDMQSRDPQVSAATGQPGGVNAAGGDAEWSADELIPFGKYMLLDRITGGATSALYRANVRGEAGFERLVAIKRILPHMAGDPEFVKTFVREAKTVARLTHSNICPIYELGKVGESLYMAIEYIAGKDLGRIARALARRGEVMPPVIAAFIAARVCDALDYAHHLRTSTGENAGVVHRDLSPTNVLVSYEGMVKLIDFGLAKAVGRAQQTNVDALKQKLGYMSPEMVKGRPIDSRSDIFGVGVLLYEMLTGRRLFAGKDDIDTLKRVGKASVPPPSAVSDDVPDELEVVVMRALERDPADRWQTAGEMAQTLSAYVQKAAPHFNTQRLSDWIVELFQDSLPEENARIKKLLAASSDNELMKRRREFFASPTGAAARARAEIRRRNYTDPPLPPRPSAAALKPPPLPKDAPSSEEDLTAFYDKDRTVAAPGLPPSADRTVSAPAPMGVFSAETRRVSSPLGTRSSSGSEDEPTHYVVSQLPPPRASEPPDPLTGGFEDEATHFLADLELEAARVPPKDMGGFEDEPTHIFFNKEEGIGVPALLDEINDVQDGKGPLNRPILAPDLLAAASAPPPRPRALAPAPAPAVAPPPAASAPPRLAPVQVAPTQRISAPTPELAPPRASAPSPVPAAPAAPPPLQAAPPAPVAAPPVGLPPMAMPQGPRNTGTFAMSELAPSTRASGMPTWLVMLSVVALSAIIGALVIATPVGVVLGLRTPQVGSIEVRTEPSTRAEIMLDGVYRGRAPLRLDRVQVGQHSIEARVSGYLPTTRAVAVTSGQTLLLHLSLEADPASAQAP